MKKYDLPVNYVKLNPKQRREVREQYIKEQKGLCFFCLHLLSEKPAEKFLSKPINRDLFPKNFFNHPVHLQHDHDTGMSEGAVHAHCNAVLWQYFGR